MNEKHKVSQFKMTSFIMTVSAKPTAGRLTFENKSNLQFLSYFNLLRGDDQEVSIYIAS